MPTMERVGVPAHTRPKYQLHRGASAGLGWQWLGLRRADPDRGGAQVIEWQAILRSCSARRCALPSCHSRRSAGCWLLLLISRDLAGLNFISRRYDRTELFWGRGDRHPITAGRLPDCLAWILLPKEGRGPLLD